MNELIKINSPSLFDENKQLNLPFMAELSRDEAQFPVRCPSCGSVEFVQACRMPCPKCGFVIACDE